MKNIRGKYSGRKCVRALCMVLFIALGVTGFSKNSLAVTGKDVEIIGKTIGFIQGGPTGAVELAIIYDAANAGSKSEAEELLSLLGSGVKSGSVTLTGKLVAVGAAGSVGSKVAFLSTGSDGAYGTLAGKGVITLGLKSDCAVAGSCVVGIQSQPKVEIHVSKSAADKAGVVFGSAFRMMITEH